MATKYPDEIDDLNSLPKVSDFISPIVASDHNNLRDAIVAIQNELGVNPSDGYNTVTEKLDAIELAIGNVGGGSSEASDINIQDVDGYFDATNVEQALREVALRLNRSPVYPFTSGNIDPWVTIYVSTSGSDVTGDGSIGNPYRQPKRALEDIILPGAGGAYVVQCGPGSFEAPLFEAYTSPAAPDSLYINIVGDKSTIIADVTLNSFTLDAGKYASWNTSVPGFSAADPYSYWLSGEYNSLPGWTYGEPILASTSGNLKVATDLTAWYDGYMAIHPFTTTFTFGGSPMGTTGNMVKLPINNNIGFTGINFVGDDFAIFQNVYMLGCTFSAASTVFFDEVYFVSTGTCPSLIAETLSGNTLTGYFSGAIQAQGYSMYSFSHNVAGGQHLNLFNQFCYLGDVDYTGTTTKIKAYGSTVTQVGPISVAGTGRWLELNQQSFFQASGTGTITGSVNGVPIDINTGSQITDVELAASGTLSNSVTPGAEINIGGYSNLAFSSLPVSDFGLGDLSEGCKGT